MIIFSCNVGTNYFPYSINNFFSKMLTSSGKKVKVFLFYRLKHHLTAFQGG